MTIISNCYEFCYLFDCTNSNPNGDPDAGNAPRQDYETGLGIVSDVCIKRKLRNYVEMIDGKSPNAIYITEGAILDNKHKNAYEALGIDDKAAREKESELTEWMCQHYYDVRMIGALMVGDRNCGKVRGPLQISMAQSIDPITPVRLSITRMAATKDEEGKDRKTMGDKWIVPYGLYRLHGYINAPLAEKSGATEGDLELLWNALSEMWHYDKSAARPEMAARSLVIVEHPRLRAPNVPDLSQVVKVKRNSDANTPARSWEDYEITIKEVEWPEGVSMIDMIPREPQA